MAPPKTSHPPAAQPSRYIFDPWNSSSTGHQRADGGLAGSTAWRASRTMKLAHQYQAGPNGEDRLHDSMGEGSTGWLGTDGRKANGDADAAWSSSSRLREKEKGSHDVRAMLLSPDWCNKGTKSGEAPHGASRKEGREGLVAVEETEKEEKKKEGGKREEKKEEDEKTMTMIQPERKKIFHDLRIYINGSTAPLVGDHKLKQLLAENGAGISIALGRRSVTHVILGTPNNGSHPGRGAGGGLAASKIQKEIKRVGGCGVRYVGVEW